MVDDVTPTTITFIGGGGEVYLAGIAHGVGMCAVNANRRRVRIRCMDKPPQPKYVRAPISPVCHPANSVAPLTLGLTMKPVNWMITGQDGYVGA